MENWNQMASVGFHTAGNIYKLDNSGLFGIAPHNTSSKPTQNSSVPVSSPQSLS